MDRKFWRGVLEAEGAFPENLAGGPDLEALTHELLGYLSSSDPELRDEFGFSILGNWIYVRHVYNPERLRSMISSLNVGLRVGLGESGTPTVFGRSFSALILSVITDYDLEHSFLTAAELSELLKSIVGYFHLERDWRGYVTDHGWAHSVAHTADVLSNLAKNPNIDAVGLERILNAIASKLTTVDSPVLAHHEASRLAVAAHNVIARGLLKPSLLHTWLDGMPDTLHPRSQSDLERGDVAPRLNCEAFLSSLYFQLLKLKMPISSRVRSHIARVLEQFGFVIV
jgi:Protein of unknown function (DUF2785)